MPLYVLCPECKITLVVGDKFAGQSVRCPKCQTVSTATPPVAAIPVFAGAGAQTGVAAAGSPDPAPATGVVDATPPAGLTGQPAAGVAAPAVKKRSRGWVVVAAVAVLILLLGLPYAVTVGLAIYALSGNNSPVAEVARQREQAQEAVETLKEIRELFKESKELVKEVKELQKELDALDPNNPAQPGDGRRAEVQGKAREKLAKMEVFKNLQKQMEELDDIDLDDPQSILGLPSPVKITSKPPTEAVTGEEFRYKVEARTKNDGPLTYTLVNSPPATVIPPGMRIEPDGVLKWQPPAEMAGQIVHVVVVVRDSTGAEKRQMFNLTVRSGK